MICFIPVVNWFIAYCQFFGGRWPFMVYQEEWCYKFSIDFSFWGNLLVLCVKMRYPFLRLRPKCWWWEAILLLCPVKSHVVYMCCGLYCVVTESCIADVCVDLCAFRTMASADLTWLIVRNSSSFLLKRNRQNFTLVSQADRLTSIFLPWPNSHLCHPHIFQT